MLRQVLTWVLQKFPNLEIPSTEEPSAVEQKSEEKVCFTVNDLKEVGLDLSEVKDGEDVGALIKTKLAGCGLYRCPNKCTNNTTPSRTGTPTCKGCGAQMVFLGTFQA
jgi:hypothetical protein